MNLFQQDAPNLYEGLTPPESQAASTDDVRRTARLAALGTLPEEASNYFEHMDRMTQIYEDQIAAEGDANIRRQIAVEDQQGRAEALAEVIRGAVPGVSDEDRQGAALAFQALTNADTAEQEAYRLEQRAVQRIQDLAAQGDITQARLYLSNLENGNALDVQRDYETRRLILQREIDRTQIEVDDQPWFRNVADFFMSWIPFDTSTGNTGNVDVAEGLTNWYDWMLSGERLRREAETLWDMPLEGFSDYVRDELIPNIRDNSRSVVGYESASQRLNILSSLGASTPEAWETNAWDAVDALGVVPFATMTRGFRALPFMVRNGARQEAVSAAVDAVLRAERSTIDDAVRATGMDADDLTEAMSPRALSVEPNELGVGIAGDVNDTIIRGREIAQRLTRQADTTGSPRLTGPEYERMVAAEVAKVRDEFGARVVDVDVRQVALAGDSSISQVTFSLGRVRGGGFATRAAAQEYGESLGRVHSVIQRGADEVVDELPEAPRSDPSMPIQDWVRKNFYGADGKPTIPRDELERQINEEIRRRALVSVTGGETLPTPVRDASGQWFVQVTRDISELGFATNSLNVKHASAGRVLSASSVSDEFLDAMAQESGSRRNKFLRDLVRPYDRTFRRLSHDERQTLDQILLKGENEGVWFSENQIDEIYARLANRSPTARELEAFRAAREINNLEYAIRNDELRKVKVLRGMENVQFRVGDFEFNGNALVKELGETPPPQRLYDIANGTGYTTANRITQEQWDAMRQAGYRMILPEEAVTLGNNTTWRTFVGRPTDMLRGPLRDQQIPYRPGGHRFYKAENAGYFVKRTVYGTQGDTGEKFLQNPDVFIAAQTRAEAEFWVKRMEAARLAYRNGDGATVIDEILGGHAGLPSADEFMELMAKKGADEPFEVLGNREMPSVYTRTPEGIEWVDSDETGFNGFLRSQGRMYTSRKGDHLPDYMGRTAPTLDSYTSLNRSLTNIAAITSFSDYKLTAVTRWNNTFKSVLDLGSFPESASEMYRFLNARYISGTLNDADAKIIREAERQRDIIRRVVGWRTPWDLGVERLNRRFADFVAGSRVDGLLPNKRRDLANWWTDQNPIGVLRGLAFDMKLGLLNIAQLPLQLSSAIAATILSPKRGLQGWALGIPSRGLLTRQTKESAENYIQTLVDRGFHSIGGFDDVAEFKEYMRTVWRSGFFDIGGSHALLDHHGPSGAVNGFLAGQDRVREFGRFFFNEGERGNRLVAWRIAWDEARARFPDVGGKIRPPRPGMTRLYRGETGSKSPGIVPDYMKQSPEFQEIVAATGRWFTESLDEARHYTKNQGDSLGISYIDVPTNKLESYRASNSSNPNVKKFSSRPQEEFFLPKDLANSRRAFNEGSRGFNDRDFLRELNRLANKYSFAMTRESKAAWQNGLLSIPTQFWAYNTRMIEALVGTSGFTTAQRIRLGTLMFALYGASGVPLVGAISDMMKNEQGAAPEIGSLGSYFDRGLIDNWFYSTTGIDVKIGERFGTGGWITDTIAEIFGHSQYGETSVADVLGGASYSILGTALGSTVETAMLYMAQESGDTTNPLQRDSLLRMARNITTVNNALKAYMVYRYGTYESASGFTTLHDLPPSTALAVALSFVPGETDGVTALRSWRENREESINDAARVITQYRINMLNRPDQRETLGEEINAFVRLLPDEIRQEALARANRSVDRSYYESMTQYYERNAPDGATN